MHTPRVETYDEWREAARDLLRHRIPPERVRWQDGAAGQRGFDFGEATAPNTTDPAASAVRVPAAFLELGEWAACHRDPEKWTVLYRALWRLTHGEPFLLEIAADEDVLTLHRMQKAVRRDAHKMKAFVRFRRQLDDLGEHFVAWHRPDHKIVRLTAPFFQRRFKVMRWSILTPDESATWDGRRLTYGPGVPASQAPPPDPMEGLWKDYYGAIFNPARIKIKAMKREMPVRHWATLPETQLIDQLLRTAVNRTQTMIAKQEGYNTSAADFFPEKITLPSLEEAAKHCQGCPLYLPATQTVFGEGPTTAEIMLVGEQPGNDEDLEGRPFVGPAGRVLNLALEQAGLDRGELYVTNAVKHFKFEMKGERRLHQKPTAREMAACHPWVEAELGLVKPKVLVLLGATAAQSLIGRDFRITQRRGQVFESPFAPITLATWHPSAVLRVPDPASREKMRAELIADLTLARVSLEAL